MRIAVIGAAGRTGRRVVEEALRHGHRVTALQRPGSHWQPPKTVDVHLGDALDRHAVSTRWATSSRSIRPLLDDRAEQERLLADSDLWVTIFRPPRLTNGRRSSASCHPRTKVGMLDCTSRADLASGLVESVTKDDPANECVYVLSEETGNGWLLRWVASCGVAEMLAIGLAGLVGGLWIANLGEPESATERWLFLASFVTVGIVEGLLIGGAQGLWLRQLFRNLQVGRFVKLTVLVAASAWAIGMLPSTLVHFEDASAESFEPSLVLVAGACALFGAVGGLLIGGAQALALKPHVRSVTPWILATALGWGLALPLDVLGASIIPEGAHWGWVLLSGGGFGALAGIVFSIPTGWVALRLHKLNTRAEAK